mgnify:FL=1
MVMLSDSELGLSELEAEKDIDESLDVADVGFEVAEEPASVETLDPPAQEAVDAPGFFTKNQAFTQALAAGRPVEQIEQRASEGKYFHPEFDGYTTEEYLPIQREDLPALDAGYTPQEVVEKKAQGKRFNKNFSGWTEPEYELFDQADADEMNSFKDARPDQATIRKLMHFAKTDLDIDAVDESYFEQRKGEWSGFNVSDDSLRLAIKNAHKKKEDYADRRRKIINEEKQVSAFERPYKAALGLASESEDPAEIAELRKGEELKRLWKAELGQSWLIDRFQGALDGGVQDGEMVSFDSFKEVYGFQTPDEFLKSMVVSEIKGPEIRAKEFSRDRRFLCKGRKRRPDCLDEQDV